MIKKLHILPVLFLGFSPLVFGQIKEEKLILDRKREPEIRKIEKKQTSVKNEKNYPPKEKRIQDSLNLKYEIMDVPAVSDFKTSMIQGQDIAPDFRNSYQNNYARFGYGNYGKILGDATFSHILENKMEVGADVHVLSTTGLKKDYPWNSQAMDLNVGAFMNYYAEKGKANVEARYGMNDFNYYGIYALQPASDVDLKQRVNQLEINGYYDYYSNNILDDVRVKTSFLGDHFGAKESAVLAEANLVKNELFTLSDVTMDAGLGLGINVQNTKFDLLKQNSANFFLVDATPELKFKKDNSHLKLGVKFNYLNNTFSAKDIAESQANTAHWYPMAEVQVGASERFNFYAGVDGGLKLNSYSDLLDENPYLVSDQTIMPTNTKYHVYLGVKGDLQQNLKYDLSGGFSKVENAAFFVHNGLFDNLNTLKRSAYNYANTFSTVYDNGSLVQVKASVQYFPIQNLALDAAIAFDNYKLDNLKNVYSENDVMGEIGAKYSMFNHKLLLGARVFFDTPNTVEIYEIAPSPANPHFYTSSQKELDVPGYVDLNLSAEYKFHKNFSIFALGNNLTGTKYQKYYGYKVLGAQILGGVKISF